jgi:uncharacterized membrane protein
MMKLTVILVSLALIVVSTLAMLAVTTGRGILSMPMMYGTWMNGYGMMGQNILLVSIAYALFIALFGIVVFWLLRMLNAQSPLDSLQTRYANGEISKEQFDALRSQLAA